MHSLGWHVRSYTHRRRGVHEESMTMASAGRWGLRPVHALGAALVLLAYHQLAGCGQGGGSGRSGDAPVLVGTPESETARGCCEVEGRCFVVHEADCARAGGRFEAGGFCNGNLCLAQPPQPVPGELPGCCQIEDDTCVESDALSCVEAGAVFVADALCDDSGRCVPAGCCQLEDGCASSDPRSCLESGGAFLAGGICDVPSERCVAPPPEPGEITGCCQLENTCELSNARSCLESGAVFIPDGICDALTGSCSPPDLAPTGCCQLEASARPFCTETAPASACAADGGLFFPAPACDFVQGVCGVAGPCECIHDLHCAPGRACNRECQCTGPFEVTLRWNNHNDVDLRVMDPFGRVLLPLGDANEGCIDTTRKPEETVFLPAGISSVGCYRVEAHHQRRCPASGIADTHLDVRTEIEGVKGTIHDVPGPQPGQSFVTLVGLRADCTVR